MNTDALFISSLIRTEASKVGNVIRRVPLNRVKGEEREIYQFIRGYYRRHRKTPSAIAIKQKYPFYEFEKTNDEADFYADVLKERAEQNILSRGFEKIYTAMSNNDMNEALQIQKDISLQLGKIRIRESATAKNSFEERKEEYYKFKELDGVIGYQTGFPSIDRHIGGIVDEMIIIMGKRGLGKTFLMNHIANSIWKQIPKEKTLSIVSNEISKKKMLKRMDSIVAKLNYSQYRKGLLSPKAEKRMLRLPRIYAKRSELIVIPGSGKSVHDVSFEILASNPAMIFCDGIYLSNQGKRDVFSNTLDASRQYQMFLGEHELPGIFTTQMNKDEETKYAGALEEDADIVIKMFQSPRMFEEEIMGLEFTKIREEKTDLKVFLNWSFERWDFSEKEGGFDDDPDATYEKEIT